jgi:hypothetical protein
MTRQPSDRPRRSPEFDPRRSEEIRRLLVNQVAMTPRPRTARLSRPAFAFAATVALLVAGGIGAGTVVAHDRLSESLDAQSTAESVSPASTGEDAIVGLSAAADVADLVPVLIVDGEVGYAQQDALDAVGVLTDTPLQQSDSAQSADSDAFAGLVPIYRADGVTLVGHYDPSAFIPE